MSELSALAAQVSRLSSARVIVVGDIMLDRFIYGEVERISPEAPVPVLRVARESAMLGGAGNVVRNLVALNVRSSIVSVVGSDEAGERIGSLVAELAGCESALSISPGRVTSIKTRCIGGTQQMLRVDHETMVAIDDDEAKAIISRVSQLLPNSDVLVLSDYGKGVLGPSLTRALIDAARAAGRPVIVDPRGSDYERYSGATVVTPNCRELELASGMPARDDMSVVAAAQLLVERCELGAVLATRSEEGMSLVEAAGAVHHLEAEAKEVYDVSGAGDTVVATLAAAVAAGLSLRDASGLANVAAGIVVGKVGTAVVRTTELVDALRRREISLDEHKLTHLGEALEAVGQWRTKSLRVGFTNGCFDLLHPGHVSLLQRARASCDRLIVGLNSDSSVQRLKGPQRPIQSEASRATVLGSLAAVDLIVVFEEDTPQRLLEAIRPDVLIKGADYKIDEVVGAAFVQSYGGRVLLVELMPEQSTSRLVGRLKPTVVNAADTPS